MKLSHPEKFTAIFVEPMKALGIDQPPRGNAWHCEIKYDGSRAVAVLNRGRVELWSHTRKPMERDYPEIAKAVARLKCQSVVLDGEIVALDDKGRSRFQLLQGCGLVGTQRPVIAYYVFDIMQLNGRDVHDLPIEERKKLLNSILKVHSKIIQLSPTFDVAPTDLLLSAIKLGLEGIIAKKSRSLYEPGRRSGAWLKCKVLGEQEYHREPFFN